MNQNYYKTVFILHENPAKWPSNFAIITAENPMDQSMTETENKERTGRLLKHIGKLKHGCLTGSSRNLLHQEKSFSVKVDFDEAINIGNKFEQRAIYYIRNGTLLLVDCSNREFFELGNFEERIWNPKDQFNTNEKKSSQ